MVDSKIYHVGRVSNEEYAWELRAEGAPRAQTLWQSREEAFAAARRLARSHPHDRVILHHPDGSVEACSATSR